MLTALPGGLPELDIWVWGLLIFGAGLSGLATGIAGFGTGIVASGLWLHALPATTVPPLVLLVSLGAQLATIGMVGLRPKWVGAISFLSPLVIGGALGIPVGVWCFSQASPDGLRTVVGALLIAYAIWQVAGREKLRLGRLAGPRPEAAAGFSGGLLGGFAGIPGPFPLIYLQLRGEPRQLQRAAFLPYSLVTISAGIAGMAMAGHLDATSIMLAAVCLPATLAGAWLGARLYSRISEKLFRNLICALLMISGLLLLFG